MTDFRYQLWLLKKFGCSSSASKYRYQDIKIYRWRYFRTLANYLSIFKNLKKIAYKKTKQKK